MPGQKKSFAAAIAAILFSLLAVGLFWLYLRATAAPLVIVHPENATPRELLGAREIRRYVYLRTGVLAEIVSDAENIPRAKNTVFVATAKMAGNGGDPRRMKLPNDAAGLGPEEYLLETGRGINGRRCHIIGGGDIGTLYGAYRFAEHLGVRFYLHGDVVPDGHIRCEIPDIHEIERPLFPLRGIQPFHDFPEGPDWWNLDDYKAIIAQLPKLRMNFFGLHTYPEGGPNAEPTVWIGLPGDIGKGGEVANSYPSSYQNTLRGNWGYAAKPTGDYLFGASQLFARDDYGNDVMTGMAPQPDTPVDSNEVFRRAGSVLGETFRLARALGVKTCVGTETPLTIPERVAERLRAAGKDPADSSVVRELYEGMFRRIEEVSPVDYYWFWTPEGWTWSGNTGDQVKATISDLNAAIAARRNAGVQFEFATCGWVLGPLSDRALFDNFLPESISMSCINRGVGTVAVDRAFSRVTGRPTWAIPWLEDDPGLTSAQLWVGRMRRDALDALRYGCEGLIGIHWRTRILGPNVSALARAAWTPEQWTAEPLISGALDGHISPVRDDPIKGTDDDPLYRTGRHNVHDCRYAVPDGTYTVILRFCELEKEEAGVRVFDVYIQGEKAAEKLDIFARAGAKTALDLTFDNVTAEDGYIDISFEPWGETWNPAFGQACISAVEIEGGGFRLAENCGGPAYKDFSADSALVSAKQNANAGYLAQTSQWEYAPARHMLSCDFYEDWAFNQFGPEASHEIAGVFDRMDGVLPRSSDWINGPGGWKPDTAGWKTRSADYSFVGELEELRGSIRGTGNIERFDYWLNTFAFMRSSAHLCCVWHEFSKALGEARAEKDDETAELLARENALPLYVEMIELLGDTYEALLGSVSTTGGLGTVANVEQHILPGLLTSTGEELGKTLGGGLPEGVAPDRTYTGRPRIIIPTNRSGYLPGEEIRLKVIVLDRETPHEAVLHWRNMGRGSFDGVQLSHIARGVYSAAITVEAAGNADIEYYIEAATAGGETLYYPPTAPGLCRTMVCMEGMEGIVR